MHPIIAALMAPLSEQQLIPPEVWLTSLELAVVPPGVLLDGDTPKTTYKARSQGTYYTFKGMVRVPYKEEAYAYVLTFWQPREQSSSKWHFGVRQGRYSFSQMALERFLAYSGDQNPLHQGETPVVPGLMIADWVLERLEGPNEAHGATGIYIKFSEPLMLGQPFDWLRTDYGYCIASGSTLYTQIHISNSGEYNDEHS